MNLLDWWFCLAPKHDFVLLPVILVMDDALCLKPNLRMNQVLQSRRSADSCITPKRAIRTGESRTF